MPVSILTEMSLVDFGRNFAKLQFTAFEFGSVILFFRLNLNENGRE